MKRMSLSQLMYTHRGVQNAASATYEVALQAAHSFSQLLAPDILHSRTFLRACGHCFISVRILRIAIRLTWRSGVQFGDSLCQCWLGRFAACHDLCSDTWIGPHRAARLRVLVRCLPGQAVRLTRPKPRRLVSSVQPIPQSVYEVKVVVLL